ncbi:MAG: M48 family metalloprotease [Rhizomicrobium sp.]
MGEHRGWGVLSLLPALFLLRFFLGQFVIAERMMQRRRELAADRLGAAVASPAELAAALTRLSSLHYVRRALRRAVQGRRLDAGQSHNLSAFFAYWAGDYFASNDAAKILKEIGAARLPHPVDTHPALRDRLAALGLEADAAWLAVPETSASALIAGVDAIEIRLSRDEAAFFSQVGNMPLRGR